MRRRGFALPFVIGVLVVTFLIAATVLQVATSDYRASRGVRASAQALLAAEAGAQLTLAELATQDPIVLAPGDSVSTSWLDLPGRAAYRTTTLRVDDGITGHVMMRILSEGRTEVGRGARSRVVLIATCPPATETIAGLTVEIPGSCAVSELLGIGSGVSGLFEVARFPAR